MQELNLKEEIPQVIAPRNMRRDKSVLQKAEEIGVELIPDIPINAPSAAERQALSAEITKQMGDEWEKSWYEIITNFPELVKYVEWRLVKQDNGQVFLEVLQDGELIDMSTVVVNFTQKKPSDKSFNINTIKTRKNGGSMFGFGTGEISVHTNDFKLMARTEGNEWDVTNIKDGRRYKEIHDEDEKFKFKQTLYFSDGNTLVEDKIKTLRIMIGLYDAAAIRKGCVHNFEVSGFSDELNKELSKPIEAYKLQWETENESGVPIPKYRTLFDKKKTPIEKVLIHSPSTHKAVSKQSKFDIKSVGKIVTARNKMFMNLGEVKDQPWCFIYMKGGRGQLLGRVPLRNLTGKINLNHVMMEVEVEKDDLRNFYSSTDKYDGFVKGFNDAVLKKLQPIIENTYKVDGSKERAKQHFVIDVIIHSKYGKHIFVDEADEHRKQLGIAWMNELTPEERFDLVVMEEWKGKASRIDIVVRYPKSLSGLTEDTEIIIEMKKDDFNLNDIKQLFLYDMKTRGCTHIWGVSCEISETNYEHFKTWKSDVNKSSQRRLNDVKGGLVDLTKKGWRWPSVEDYYQNKVDLELEKIQNKKKK